MTNFINPFCQPVVQFNRDNADKINALCAPLRTHFGITAFFYIRMFDDGRYLLLANNEALLDTVAVYDYNFKTEYFAQAPEIICKKGITRDIWPEDVKDASVEFLRSRGLCNGMSLGRELDGSLEAGCFITNEDNEGAKELYSDHSDVLADFISDFRTLGGDLTRPTGQASLGVSPHMRKTYPKIDMIFKKKSPWERNIIEFNESLNTLTKQEICEVGKRHSLTFREIECLSYFTTGKTAKEIARILDIAPRTIEAHLNNIRLKTGCQTKIELTHWFEETFNAFLVKTPFGGLVL